MISSKILRVVLLPAASLVSEDNSKPKKPVELKCRPSELPIYSQDTQQSNTKQNALEEGPPAMLEEGISVVRQHLTRMYNEVKAYQRVGEEYFEQSKDNAEWLIKYLQQEDNTLPKAGAIAIGGLTGLIFGLRGGFLKRTIYATTGALAMASLCYPKEAAEYSKIGIGQTRKYATIAYNFAYGVKKGDPPLELPTLPKLPNSLTEVWDNVTKSASNIVSGGEEKESKAKEKKV